MPRRLTWGDLARVSISAPPAMRPGELGDIVAIDDIKSEQKARDHEAAIGTKVYLIEFGDGVAIDVPERWVEEVE